MPYCLPWILPTYVVSASWDGCYVRLSMLLDFVKERKLNFIENVSRNLLEVYICIGYSKLNLSS